MKKAQTRLFCCIAALAVMGCVLTGCGAKNSIEPSAPSETPSYVVDENENTITAADNSWTIELVKGSDSSVITQTYTNAVQDLDSAPISTYTILMDTATTYNDGSKLLTRLIAVSEEDVENSFDALLLSAALPEKDGTFYAILGYEYDATGVLVHTWMSNTDKTLQYTYAVANGDWEYDSAQTDNAFLDKFHALFTTLDEDLQGFLQEQQPTLEKVAADAAQLVDIALPILDSGSCGESTTWKLTKDGVLTISGDGETDTYTIPNRVSTRLTPWHEYRDLITKVKVESGITFLGDCIFYDLTSLKDVEIASSVTKLGSSVFYGCTALEEIVLPDSIDIASNTRGSFGVFNGCTSLTKVTLPACTTEVSTNFFSDCTSLTSITIPRTVTYFGIGVFDGCTSLTDIYFEGTEAEWAKVTIDDIDNEVLLAATVHCAQ